MKSIRTYVNRIFADTPESDEKKAVKEEIILSLEEKVSDLKATGKSEEDAINKAIVDFGDISEIKEELFSNHKKGRIRKAALRLGFSLIGSAMIVGLCIFVNLYYTPKVIWYVYPTFVVAWWPLSMFYVWLNRRQGE